MNATLNANYDIFLATVAAWQTGYTTGSFNGNRYGVAVARPVGGRVTKVYAEALDGSDIVSFNVFYLDDDRQLLKPCEMSSEKVQQFALGFMPDKTTVVE